MSAPAVRVAPPAAPASSPAGLSGRFGSVLAALEAKAPARTALDTGDPAALLAAQAALYREAERVELASRIVDQAVSAVKTLLQTRV